MEKYIWKDILTYYQYKYINRLNNGGKQMKPDTIVLLDEKRIFKPSVETVERAHVKNWEIEIEKGKDFEKYWEEKAEDMDWFQEMGQSSRRKQ